MQGQNLACLRSNAAAERIKANAARVVVGPMEVPGGSWVLQAQDPQGVTFALHHIKA